jgi:hypothetical protein
MNKLVIIGNGFDLAHGLKTKYSDFFLDYLNRILNYLLNTDEYVYEDDLICIEGVSRINRTFTIRKIKDFELVKRNSEKFNFKSKFAETLFSSPDDANWVNIETEYYYHLKAIFVKYENESYTKNTAHYEVGNLNRSFNCLRSKLHDYLNSLTPETTSHDDFAIKALFADIKDQVSQYRSDGDQIHFLNFNYTSTIEKYLDQVYGYVKTLNYIHGKLNSPDNPIIFGYGDEIDPYYEKIENLNSNIFLDHFKSFSYSKTNNYRDIARFIDSKRFHAIVLGHSCGISDRVLLSSIFEHDNCHSIKFYYHQKENGENDFFERTQEISRHFKAANRHVMRKKIISLQDSKPLFLKSKN